jgi:hypothetical protein
MEEALFVPCTRMRALMRAWNRDHRGPDQKHFPENVVFNEVDLQQDLQDILLQAESRFDAVGFLIRKGFMFNDLWDLAKRKIVWMGPDLFMKAKGKVVGAGEPCRCFGFGRPIVFLGLPDLNDDDGDNELQVYSRPGNDATTTGCVDVFQWMTRVLFYFRKCYGNRPSTDLYSISCDTDWSNEAEAGYRFETDAITAIPCDYLFRLMTESNTNWTYLESDVLTPVSTLVLRPFLERSRGTGGNIRFGRHYDLLHFPENYLRVLWGDWVGPLHKLFLGIGTKEGGWSQERNILVTNFFRSCQCAVALDYGRFPGPAPLVNVALSGNCNIVDLVLVNVPDVDGGLFQELGNNNSLLRLTFLDTLISEANWTALCQSLARHSTLGYLRLHRTFPHEPADTSSVRKAHRTSAFLRMLQTNTALQELVASGEISDPRDEFDDGILMNVIQPCLSVSAFAGADPSLDVFVEALSTVQLDNIDLTWMLIRRYVPTILGFQQGNAQEAMAPNA